jgi:hypothetical protein
VVMLARFLSWWDVKDLRRIPGYNVRVKGALYRNRVEKLATLMLDHGFDEASPLVGMLGREGSGRSSISSKGNTRLDAIETANAAGAAILQAPVLLSAEQMNGADFTLDLILSNSGAPLSLYEQGLAYNRSANEGLSNCEMARRTSVSEGHVRNARDLAKVPERLVEALAAGLIAETLALELWRAFGGEVVERLTPPLKWQPARSGANSCGLCSGPQLLPVMLASRRSMRWNGLARRCAPTH